MLLQTGCRACASIAYFFGLAPTGPDVLGRLGAPTMCLPPMNAGGSLAGKLSSISSSILRFCAFRAALFSLPDLDSRLGIEPPPGRQETNAIRGWFRVPAAGNRLGCQPKRP